MSRASGLGVWVSGLGNRLLSRLEGLMHVVGLLSLSLSIYICVYVCMYTYIRMIVCVYIYIYLFMYPHTFTDT